MRLLLSQKNGLLPRCVAAGGATGLCLALWLLALGACAPRPESTDRAVVAATIFPLADWLRNLVPENTEVITLVSPSQNPHTFEPGIAEAKLLSRCRLVVRMGYGYDDWIDRLVQGTRGESTEVLVLEQAEAESTFEAAQESAVSIEEATETAFPDPAAEEHEAEQDHGHSDRNPHLWLDPIWAQDAVRMMAERLKAIWPEKAVEIDEKTQNYLVQLAELHQRIAATVAQLPHKSYVGYHGAFVPFAKRYGLEETISIEEWGGKEPSLERTKKVVEALKAMPRPVLFVEPQISRKTAEVFAQEAGCPVYILDPIGDPNSADRNGYIPLMQFNLNSLQQGLADSHDR